MNVIAEICCGSYYDAKQAYLGGASRVELNSSLHLGGLTPSLGALELTKQETNLYVITMIRPRGAGFYYESEDFQVMLLDCKRLMEHGADGAAFGFLQKNKRIDIEKTKRIVDIIKSLGGEAVFHRAFDCVNHPYEEMEILIDLGVDRVLTSGLENKAMDGLEVIKKLQNDYGDRIEILAGSGINASNAKTILDTANIHQIHSSCKDWITDVTTTNNHVSYAYGGNEYVKCYDVVSKDLVEKLICSIVRENEK